MNQRLQGMKVAILVADGFEQVELTEPRTALAGAGATTHVVSPAEGKVKGWDHTDWGSEIDVDVPLEDAEPAEYDALVLPGGVMNPDNLRRLETAQHFVRHFFATGKPVASICHGPWTLIDAGVVDGRQMTSYPTIQVDLMNAGARWIDQEVVEDRGLVTSRNPDDLPAFNQAMIELFARSQVTVGS